MQPGQLPKREVKDIYLEDGAYEAILRGATKAFKTVSMTYGPAGRNVMLGLPFGDPTVTRDGVTVMKRIILRKKEEDDAAQVLKQASEKTNRSAGDGTTATVVLAYHLLAGGHRLIAAGDNGMAVKKQIAADSLRVIEFLKKHSEAGKDRIKEVATVSAGDSGIGALIADTLAEVGTEGGVSIREQNYPTLNVEKVNGYYFDRGFFALNQQVEYAKPWIFVTQKQLVNNDDIIPILGAVIDSTNKNLVIIGDVRNNSDALNTLILNVLQGKLNAVVVPPPAFNDDAKLYMEDISLYVGSLFLASGQSTDEAVTTVQTPDGRIVFQPKKEYFGTADRVQVSQDRATIFGGAGDAEAITDRAAQIRDNIEKETSSHRKDQLEQRYARLTGKVAIVNVGSSTPAEMEELRYRVEDAIEATKSAMEEGVLPGGGTMYVRAAHDLELSPLFRQALLATFNTLMENAGESGQYRSEQIAHSKPGWGFNLRDMSDKPVNLKEAGIFDATRAITQTVENAVSAAGTLLTLGAIIEPVEQEKDK